MKKKSKRIGSVEPKYRECEFCEVTSAKYINHRIRNGEWITISFQCPKKEGFKK